MAEQELERISHITRQTLTFYRESKFPIPVQINELLEDVLGLQDRLLKSSRIELRKKFSISAQMRGFPVELRQVFLNLIGNAIQAMPEGGTLGVSVREATDWTSGRSSIVISIVDTGKGIQPGDARRLFEPFFTTKSNKGTGLGLWISKGIVQKYEGRISFRSHRRAGGCTTCFRVFLPGSCTTNAAIDTTTDPLTADYTRSKADHDAPLIQAARKGIAFELSSNS